jgi:hypothetical protein
MAQPTRFPNGVTNAPVNSPLGEYPLPDPTVVHQFFEDFDNFEQDQWLTTAVGTGTRTATSADGGILLLTNSAADDDSLFSQYSGDDAAGVIETWKFVAGKKLWFKARFKVSDATQSDFVMGLQITDTAPVATTDGVYFRKDDGDALLDFVVTKDSVATTQTGVYTVVSDTYLTTGFFYDGTTSIDVFVNDAKVASSVLTNLVDDEELTISFGVQNGEAVIKTMSVDYIFVAKER